MNVRPSALPAPAPSVYFNVCLNSSGTFSHISKEIVGL